MKNCSDQTGRRGHKVTVTAERIRDEYAKDGEAEDNREYDNSKEPGIVRLHIGRSTFERFPHFLTCTRFFWQSIRVFYRAGWN